MIAVDIFKGRTIGILGLGGTGVSMARALHAGGANVIAWDDAEKMRGRAQGITIVSPEDARWQSIHALAASPGAAFGHETPHPLVEKARARGIDVFTDIELFARVSVAKGWNVPIVAITGTNGKSTSVALLGHVLNAGGFIAQVGGNIGTPVLDLEPPGDRTVYVLELSSFQLALTESFHPRFAALLNLRADHTDKHGGLEAYAEAKARLFACQGAGDVAVIGMDDPLSARLATRLRRKEKPPRIISVRTDGAFDTGVSVHDGKLIDALGANAETHEMPPHPRLSGRHNRQNIASVYTLARALGIVGANIMDAIGSFPGLPHRMEPVGRIGNVDVINDSKATNADAAAAAIASCKKTYRNIYWIAGGRAKPEGLSSLEPARAHIHRAYFYGEAKEDLAKFSGKRVPHETYDDLETAVRAALSEAKADSTNDSVVLFSPACSSFDAHSDFVERGEAFRASVRRASEDSGTGKRPIIIAAGGTGGHVFPAQELARALNARGASCILMTDRRGRRHVEPGLWYKTRLIPSAPVSGMGIFGLIRAAIKIPLGIVVSLISFRLRRPGVVVGFGGYPSVPPLLAAALMKIPVCVHEPGATLGGANKWLVRLAASVALSFPVPVVLREKDKHKRIATGLPVRKIFMTARAHAYVRPEPKGTIRLLVLGGSQGAQALSRLVSETLALMSDEDRKRVQLTMQCRKADRKLVKKTLTAAGIKAEIEEFFPDIAVQLVKAHLVIARAGASMVGEIAVSGRPAILVPITGAPGSEQSANAYFLSNNRAGWMLPQNEISPNRFAQCLTRLFAQPVELARAAQSARALAPSLGYPDAAEKLADLVEMRAGQPGTRRIQAVDMQETPAPQKSFLSFLSFMQAAA